MRDYTQMIKTSIGLLVLIGLWLFCLFFYLMPYGGDNLSEQHNLVSYEKSIALLTKTNQALTQKNNRAEKLFATLASGVVDDLQIAQIKFIKTVQAYNLVSLLTQTEILENDKNNQTQAYKTGIIHYQLSGTYPDYWRFKQAVKQLDIAYKTQFETLNKNDQGQLVIKGELSVLLPL